MSVVRPVKFRHNAAIPIAALVAFLGAVPVATARWYLAPILLAPVLVAIWGWRAGTDADATGVRLRALAGTRRIAWSRITGLAPDERGRVYARLDGGTVVRLPAVGRADLPRLVAAGGGNLAAAGAAETGDTETGDTETGDTETGGGEPPAADPGGEPAATDGSAPAATQ
jgi:hypothetical protein